MADQWNDPDTSDFFTIKDHVGDLVIIAVNKFTPNFPTINGERDTIHAEVVIVEGKDQDTRYSEALLFGSKLVPQLRNKMGAVVLGRIALGDKMPGKNAPYILTKPTDDDKAMASKWTAANGDVVPSKVSVTGHTTTEVGADEDFPY